jgi:deoxyribodipyrimidine photo-lyase
MPGSNTLVYIVRRDLRVSDNPIIHRLASSPDHGFTNLLPVYIFPPHQIEVSGFVRGGQESPYPEARSHVGRFWRCGPHRAKFLTASVWNLKESLEALGSGLTIRVGHYGEVLQSLIGGLREKGHQVGAVWVTSDEGVEERRDETHISSVCSDAGVEFLSWVDEKYFIDE